MILKDS